MPSAPRSAKRAASTSSGPVARSSNPPTPQKHLPEAKLSWKEQRELDALPDRIALLEAEQTELTQRLAEPGLHADQPQEAHRVAERLAAIETELLTCLERWEHLETRSAG